MSPDYGLAIAEAFQKYLKTGEISHIDGYSAKELRTAISRLSPFYDHNKMWYREIQKRIEGLNTVEVAQNQAFLESFKQKWLDKLIAFGLGLLSGLLF